MNLCKLTTPIYSIMYVAISVFGNTDTSPVIQITGGYRYSGIRLYCAAVSSCMYLH